jgi:hypothetical protein
MKDVRKQRYEFISARTVFRISLWVFLLTILGVYFWGLGRHNTFFENSVISTTILSLAFFVFITVGLYKGVKLKHEPSQTGIVPVTDSIGLAGHTPDSGFDFDVGEGLGGILLALVLWILWAIVVAIALWIFSNVVLLVIATFAAMLYWIFFRAMRLVFKNSNKSKGDMMASIGYGLTYTVLYNFWIYGIFLLTAYLKK